MASEAGDTEKLSGIHLAMQPHLLRAFSRSKSLWKDRSMPLPTLQDLLWDSGQHATSLNSFCPSTKWGDGSTYAFQAWWEDQRNPY